VKNGRGLDKKVHPVPEEIDSEVASLKLRAMGVNIDRLTKEQKKYLETWEAGT